jgi:hypothetical protein
VLDQGFNTLDLFHLAGGQIVRRYTGGETLGQRRAAKVMQDLLLQKGERRFSLHEADEYVRLACNGRRAELLVKGEAFDLKPLARQVLDIAAGEVRAYLSQTWEDGATEKRVRHQAQHARVWISSLCPHRACVALPDILASPSGTVRARPHLLPELPPLLLG